MKTTKNKIAAIVISICFILSIAAPIVLEVKAPVTAVPGILDGYVIYDVLYLVVGPNPIGVGQQVNLNGFLGSCLPDREIPNTADPENFNVTVTSPSGRVEVFTLNADKTGGGYYTYTPTEVGEYKVKASYGGQDLTVPGWIGISVAPAESEVVTLTVQEEPVTQRAYPYTPLPTNWWQTPVSAQNSQNWYKIMGPVLFRNQYNHTTYANPYTEPVTSAHLIWTKPWTAGGVIGARAGGGETNAHWWTVRQYETPFSPVIIDGKMWAQHYPQGTRSHHGIYCVDLYTGEDIYWLNTSSTLYCGMATDQSTGNMYGGLPYVIWTTGSLAAAETGGTPIYSRGTQYNMFDGMTGQYILSIVNGTGLSGLHEDDMGNLIGYYTNSSVGTMYLWDPPPFDTLLPNGSSVSNQPQLDGSVTIDPNPYGYGGIPHQAEFNFTKALWCVQGKSGGIQVPLNTVIDFKLGVEWVAPLPQTLDGGVINPALSFSKYTGDALIYKSHLQPSFFWQNGWMIIAGFDPENGNQMWIQNLTYPETDVLIPWARGSWFQNLYAQGKYFIMSYRTWKFIAYDPATGHKLYENQLKTDWGDGHPSYYDELAESVTSSHNIDGQMIIATFGGDIWNVNVTDGSTIWYTNTTNLIGPVGVDNPFGTWVLWSAFNPMLLDRGCFYAMVGHCYNPPLFHGAQLIAVNMTNGEKVWSYLDFPVMQNAEAYGVLLSYNCYDGQIYAFRKGPSATTVTAPTIGVTTATPITITGTVMDVSPGTKQTEQALNFPNGLPCVSDESQSKWMEHVYQNQPFPTDVTGVVVTLSVEDANGNVYEIGTTTSDTSGSFGFTWTPIISGDYKVMATFAGSESYYGSSDAAYFYASEAPQPTPAPTPEPAPMTDTYVLGFGIGAIIAILAIGLVIILMLRKR